MHRIIKITAILFALCLFTGGSSAFAQRLQEYNHVGWMASFNTIYLTKKVSLVGEYHWRRVDYVKNWQQSLTRVGLQYNFSKDVAALAGYAYIITYPYGDYPVGPYHVPEHRIYEQIQWSERYSRLEVLHRLRLEQRLIGRVNQKAAAYDVSDYSYRNRVRYMLRLNMPINKKVMEPHTWYASAFDELFIGFGSNVNQNVYDQNRIALLGGYQFSKSLKFEAGFYNQIAQQASLVSSKQVYQYNTGFMTNLVFTHK